LVERPYSLDELGGANGHSQVHEQDAPIVVERGGKSRVLHADSLEFHRNASISLIGGAQQSRGPASIRQRDHRG
jgi:hypothetical protein